MVKKLKVLFLAAAFACGSAHAVVSGQGTDPQGGFLLNAFPAEGSFEDAMLFDLSTLSSVSSTATSQWFGGAQDGLRNLTLSLFQGNNLIQSVGPSSPVVIGGAFGAFTTVALNDLLPAGSYRLELSGDIRPLGGNYVWTLNTVAVPEPEQWAMMIVGLALVAGWAARRRKNAS
jgi:hypothetical protein